MISQNYPTKYWHALPSGKIQCDLCPQACKLSEGQRGICFVRLRENDQVVLTTYCRSSGFAIDPVEKKPLNHFLPGTSILSFGTAGCNLTCRFCQNWDISKAREMDILGEAATPIEIAKKAKSMGCQSVAFTYNEPIIFMEYAIEVAKECHELNIVNENRISGLAPIDPSSLGIPRGAAERATGVYSDVHEGEAEEGKAQLFPAERLLQGCKRLAVCAKQDAARKAERRPQQSGKPKCDGYIKTVAVTNGYICEEPRKEFFSYMDAANVDLKGFTEDFYKKITGSALHPVLETLKYLKHQTKVWFEITTLLIPGLNDSAEEIEKETKWIVDNLGCDVPIHFTAFHPAWKMMEVPPTPLETLIRARDIAMKNGIRYAYTGNLYHPEGSKTFCHNCKNCIIAREGYVIAEYNLSDDGHCTFCGALCAGVFSGVAGDWGGKRRAIKI